MPTPPADPKKHQEVDLLNSDFREIYGVDLSSVAWRWKHLKEHSKEHSTAAPPQHSDAVPLENWQGVERERIEEQGRQHQGSIWSMAATSHTGTHDAAVADGEDVGQVEGGGDARNSQQGGRRKSVDGPVSGWHANREGIGRAGGGRDRLTPMTMVLYLFISSRTV